MDVTPRAFHPIASDADFSIFVAVVFLTLLFAMFAYYLALWDGGRWKFVAAPAAFLAAVPLSYFLVMFLSGLLNRLLPEESGITMTTGQGLLPFVPAIVAPAVFALRVILSMSPSAERYGS